MGSIWFLGGPKFSLIDVKSWSKAPWIQGAQTQGPLPLPGSRDGPKAMLAPVGLVTQLMLLTHS